MAVAGSDISLQVGRSKAKVLCNTKAMLCAFPRGLSHVCSQHLFQMSLFPSAHNLSISHSQLTTGDQFNFTNCTFDSSGPRADDERKTIANWLSLLDFSLTQNEIFHRRAEGTGQWLLESKEFEEWRDGISETLFCPGMPGAGKTSLISIVINHLQTRFRANDKVAIAYIYLDYKKQAQQLLTNLVSSLLKQLIQIHTCSLDDIKVFYQQHKVRNTRPTLDDLKNALKTEVSKLSKTFIIIDAVDELTEDNGTRADLLTLPMTLPDNVNLMVTSRHIDSITVYFQDTRRLEIRAHDEDVRKYIQSRIPRWYSKQLGETVTSEIVKKAEGMFLLARLHMDSLLVKHSPAKVIRALETLPRGMDETYDEAMKRIQQQVEEDRELAYLVLSWIVFAYRPLSVDELQCALAISSGMTHLDREEFVFEECLTSYCAGLVIIDEESRIIRLVHYTTQEYFENRRRRLFPDTQTIITRTCLTYLLFDEYERGLGNNFEEIHLFTSHHPLLKYAALHWGRHANGLVEEIEEPLLLKFLQSPHHVAVSCQILLKHEIPWHTPNPIPFPSLHLCAFFGLCHIIKHLLDNGEELNLRDSWGRTPLSWAACKGHNGTVDLLLVRKGIEINTKDQFGQTPLSYAAKSGRDGIVRLLLAQDGIDINAKGKFGRTPLSLAASQGHDGIVHLLLTQDGIDVNVKESSDRTPLSFSTERGHDGIVRLLLAHEGIDINAADGYGQTPLSYAAELGHDEIVRLLLAHEGIDINASDRSGRTPLLYAAGRGYDGIVGLLLAQEGIDINAKSKYGQTPLLIAIERGHDRIVRLILAKEGIDIKARDKNGRTALSWAADGGHDGFVRQLLAYEGIDINSKTEYGQTSLSFAAERGHDEIVVLLLAQEGIDINAQSKYGQTPLSFAAERGHDRIVCLLLAQEGIDIKARDKDGRTALLYAAEGGHDGIVRRLLTYEGVGISTKDENGWTPLSCAAQEGNDEVVGLLLEQEDIDINVRDEDGWTPLSRAASQGHDGIVRLLLAYEGIDINTKDEDGWTPLSHAAEQGHDEIVRILLAYEGIDVNARDEIGLTPLSFAAEGGHDEIVRLLLAHKGIDINANDKFGRTPLSWAAEGGHDAIVGLLLSQEDIDINAKDEDGRTPLSRAAEGGHDAIVDLLHAHEGIDTNSKEKEGLRTNMIA